MFLTLLDSPLAFLIIILSLIISIGIHEFAHAYTADHLGDPTPRLQGRVTLNPLAHLDPWGMLFVFFFGFGWGKPVMFDPFNLKNPRRDAAIISVAGPISNIVLAVLLAFIYRLLPAFGHIFFIMITLNISLAVFNLLPIHPLDGFKIVGGLLNREQAKKWYRLERFGIIFLLLLIMPLGTFSLLDAVVRPIIGTIVSLLMPDLASIFSAGSSSIT